MRVLFTTNAARVRDENAALPGIRHAMALLDRLALVGQPIQRA